MRRSAEDARTEETKLNRFRRLQKFKQIQFTSRSEMQWSSSPNSATIDALQEYILC